MNMPQPSRASDRASAAVLRLRIVSSVAVHAAAVLAVWGGGHVHHARVTPHPHHDAAPAIMITWVTPAAPAPAPAPATQPRRAVPKQKQGRATATTARANVDRHEPLIEPAPPAPAAPAFDAAAFAPPPPAIQAPSESNVWLRFVGIEDGQWLRWLAERHGFVAFTTRRDTVIEHAYSVSGELVPLSAVPFADAWSLEVDQPERVAALAGMVLRERERAADADSRIRVFALFPASFRDEVTAAVRQAGVTGESVLVSFSASDLKVVTASLSESKK
jgi:hypothetical protein